MDIILIICVCLFALFIIRVEIVYRANIRAIDKIFEGNNSSYLLKKYDPVGNFDKNVFNPMKWTYSQIFRGLDDD